MGDVKTAEVVTNGNCSTVENKIGNKQIVNKQKLWTLNFFLLWQGQFISAFGDVIYEIALGFWILEITGSKALMGTLMATSMIPRLIISPFAGVVVDRVDRKKLMVLMDFIRGFIVVFVGIAAIFHFVQIWMVFVAGIILGICGAFFNPSIMSVLPDIVEKSKIIKANSALNMVYAGTNMAANPVGGILYSVLGAPLMFLFNGISYLFSSLTEVFIKVPKIKRDLKEVHFWDDLKQGFKFVWKFKSLRYFIFIGAILNFFASMAIVLFLPFFQETSGLGSVKYGFAMAVMSGGMFLGMLFTSIVNIPYEKRAVVFIVNLIAFGILFSIALFLNYYVMLSVLAIGGFLNAIVNVFFSSTVQLTVPQEMRGKVGALMSTVLMGLAPLGIAFGGIIAEFVSIKMIVLVSFAISTIVSIILGVNKDFKAFINFNPDKQVLEDIM